MERFEAKYKSLFLEVF